MRTLLISTSIVAAGLLTGCSEHICSTELRSVTVVVTDLAGNPVDDLAPVSTYDRTGTTISVLPLYLGFEPGGYTVIDDSQTNVLDGRTEGVTFTVTSSQGSATGHYEIEGDDCHITKVDGPDTLVLQ